VWAQKELGQPLLAREGGQSSTSAQGFRPGTKVSPMKCIQCGYFNLPQALTCGRCGVDLAHPTPRPGGTLQESLYPPRARERTVGTQVRLRLRVPAVPLPSPASLASLKEVTQPWLVMTAALIPGLGHLLLGDRRRGTALALAAFLTLALALAWLRTDLSDLLFWVILGIICWSVWDIADRAFPTDAPGMEDRALRGLRLAFLSVAMVAGTVASLYWLAGLWYPRYEITDNWTGAVLQKGDAVTARRLSSPFPDLRRGDVVVVNSGEYPIIERVIGLPGDRVDSAGGVLWVNGRRAGAAGSPLDGSWARSTFHTVVPPDQVCFWLSPTGIFRGEEGMYGDGGRPPQASFGTVSVASVEARVLAVLEPPAHRRRLVRGS
jgi:hypothetical protein